MPTIRTRRRRRLTGLAVSGLAVAGLAAASPAMAVDVDLAITKTADRATAAPGDTITYTLIVENVGQTNVDRFRVEVSDPALPNLVRVTGPRVLEPGDRLRYEGSRVVGPENCGVLPNTATVALSPPKVDRPEELPLTDTNPADNTSTATVTVQGEACVPPPPPPPPPPPVTPPPVTPPITPPPATGGTTTTPPKGGGSSGKPVCVAPDLGATISGPSYVQAGAPASYRVVIRNDSSKVARGTKVRITLPSGLALGRRAPGVTVRNRQVTIPVGTIAGNRARGFLIPLRTVVGTTGSRLVRVTATAECGQAATAATRTLVGSTRTRIQPAVTG